LNKKIKSFKIYYGDYTTHSGKSMQDWQDAPEVNVQAILFEYEDGKPEVIHNRDWYAMLENQHGLRFEADWSDNNVEFADRCDPKGVKIGYSLNHDDFYAIMKIAQDERDAL